MWLSWDNQPPGEIRCTWLCCALLCPRRVLRYKKALMPQSCPSEKINHCPINTIPLSISLHNTSDTDVHKKKMWPVTQEVTRGLFKSASPVKYIFTQQKFSGARAVVVAGSYSIFCAASIFGKPFSGRRLYCVSCSVNVQCLPDKDLMLVRISYMQQYTHTGVHTHTLSFRESIAWAI